jgi:hypothetical protein
MRIKNRNNKRKKKNERKSPNSGASVNKRPKTSSRTVSDDDSEIIESEESEALPETFGGETKESDSDRRGREKEERKRQQTEEAAERERQRGANIAASQSIPCLANIGGIRVEKNGIIEFEGGETFEKWTKQEAEDATGILKKTIKANIHRKNKSSGTKGIFKGQQVMFINAPVDTSNKVPCGHCTQHFSITGTRIQHVRKFHPGVLPPARKNSRMPEEFETFTTRKQYAIIIKRIKSTIKCDRKKHNVTEEDKVKLMAMDNRETYHMIARQICEHMNAKGMFADYNVIDDNGGLIKHGFVFRSHGGLFNVSLDRIEDNADGFYKLHFPDPKNALKNIHVVAQMANVACKASTATIQTKVTDFENKSVEQRKKDFKKVLDISNKKTQNGERTPLYAHANNTWANDNKCKGAFDTYQAYWRHLLVLLEDQEGLCAVATIPMSLESGPWLMSCDAIDPRLGHVPDNLRLVCFYNNPTNHSKQNKALTDTTPTSLNTVLHDEYWRIVR